MHNMPFQVAVNSNQKHSTLHSQSLSGPMDVVASLVIGLTLITTLLYSVNTFYLIFAFTPGHH